MGKEFSQSIIRELLFISTFLFLILFPILTIELISAWVDNALIDILYQILLCTLNLLGLVISYYYGLNLKLGILIVWKQCVFTDMNAQKIESRTTTSNKF